VSVSVVARFLVRGVVEGLIFTVVACVLGTLLVLRSAERREGATHQATAPCRAGDFPQAPCLTVSGPGNAVKR
jgi:hypothetical protein